MRHLFFSSVLALTLLAAPASAQLASCPGDANGDGIVDFLDVVSELSNWLASYAPGTGPGDGNGDGIVDFNDIESTLNNWLVPCPPIGAATFEPVVIALTLDTPDGPVPLLADMRLQFNFPDPRAATRGVSGPDVPLDLATLSLVGNEPVVVQGTPLGQISVFMGPPQSCFFDGVNFSATFDMNMTYPAIDLFAPPIQEPGDEEESGVGQTEVFNCMIEGTLIYNPATDDFEIEITLAATADEEGLLTGLARGFFGGAVGGGAARAAAGAVKAAAAPCAMDKKAKKRKIKIQPVYFERADMTRTDTSRAALQAAATAIWGKCCVEFEFLEPVKKAIPMGVDIDKVNAAQRTALLADDANDKALEVIFVGGFDPITASGGALVNAVGRGAGGRGLFANNCMDGSAMGCGMNTNAMAHEIGHILGLCHPTDAACPAADPAKGGGKGYNKGTAGSVMDPSGAAADNPDKNSMLNCKNADNALMTPTDTDCCLTTD